MKKPTEPTEAAIALRHPCVSIMVPLYKEREIANALVQRLQRLTYPKALLDVILVLEATDDVTRDALARVALPSWMRVVEVPELNGLTTKPRAMNYALDFCRGDIVGVWDAEDAPQPDQIERVVAHFTQASPEVVCLQGVLDYYNPRTNWRSRCFTIEYNSWFRVILPGIARMGLVVPLGGTTFFFAAKSCWNWAVGTPTMSPKMPIWACGFAGRVTGPRWWTPPPSKRRISAPGRG